jgi:hypothetical protein
LAQKIHWLARVGLGVIGLIGVASTGVGLLGSGWETALPVCEHEAKHKTMLASPTSSRWDLDKNMMSTLRDLWGLSGTVLHIYRSKHASLHSQRGESVITFSTHTARQVLEDVIDSDSASGDARVSASHVQYDRDALEQVHARWRKIKTLKPQQSSQGSSVFLVPNQNLSFMVPVCFAWLVAASNLVS